MSKFVLIFFSLFSFGATYFTLKSIPKSEYVKTYSRSDETIYRGGGGIFIHSIRNGSVGSSHGSGGFKYGK